MRSGAARELALIFLNAVLFSLHHAIASVQLCWQSARSILWISMKRSISTRVYKDINIQRAARELGVTYFDSPLLGKFPRGFFSARAEGPVD
jgi:hypothetical protein